MSTYAEFLERKLQANTASGFEPLWMPDFLFPFQRALVEWAVHMGRAALFADCGLGKSPMLLTWAHNVHLKTGKPVLVATPLGVAAQLLAEAEKFGVEAAISRDGSVPAPIVITNYERLHHFQPDQLGGMVCDESSILKNFDGATKAAVTEFMRTLPYRLLDTATAAPNDYVELGTSSEALGYLGFTDMLSRFFTNAQGNIGTGRGYLGKANAWRFRGHAEEPFWRWVTSWARAIRRPSDLGYDDTGFDLPPLEYRQHLVTPRSAPEGVLFELPAVGLQEEREEQRRTLTERCEAAASLASEHDVSILWCHLNDEGDLLERLVPNSVQVRGSDSPEFKEAAIKWFTGQHCICHDLLFRGKLATWWRGPRGIGETTTPHIASNASLSPTTTSDDTPMNGVNTCDAGPNGTRTASVSTEPTRLTNETPNVASVTRKTLPTGSKCAESPGNGRQPTQTSASLSGSASSVSPLTNTGNSSVGKGVGVPSAGANSAPPVANGSTSITAINQAESGVPSVAPATWDSESSLTIQTDWSELHCICGHASGIRRLISKPVMFGYGLNLQHCDHMTYFPNHSYEALYQAVRRCWRFGQTNPVTVDLVTTEGGLRTLANLQRKAATADRMFDALVTHMRDGLSLRSNDRYDTTVEVPQWLAS